MSRAWRLAVLYDLMQKARSERLELLKWRANRVEFIEEYLRWGPRLNAVLDAYRAEVPDE
jgi:hypothetical protein